MKNNKPKLLVIDDESDLAEIFKFRIEQEDIEVDMAFNGKEGIDKMHSENYDLVITDLKMPVTSGLNVISIAKQLEIPYMVATAFEEEYHSEIPPGTTVIKKPFK